MGDQEEEEDDDEEESQPGPRRKRREDEGGHDHVQSTILTLFLLLIYEFMSLPNFQFYYWATNMHRLLLWFTSPQSSWCQLETASCMSSPQVLACSTLPTPLSQYTDNPIVTATLKIWAQIRRNFKWSTPICNNHLFLPASIDPRFMALAKRGLRYLENLYVDGSFTSFN